MEEIFVCESCSYFLWNDNFKKKILLLNEKKVETRILRIKDFSIHICEEDAIAAAKGDSVENKALLRSITRRYHITFRFAARPWRNTHPVYLTRLRYRRCSISAYRDGNRRWSEEFAHPIPIVTRIGARVFLWTDIMVRCGYRFTDIVNVRVRAKGRLLSESTKSSSPHPRPHSIVRHHERTRL